MMNFVAIFLVLTSLLTAEVWSPSPETKKQNLDKDVIVKEGHRTIVVETFDENGHHNTKVSISPEIPQPIKEASRILPNIDGKTFNGGDRYAPGELICDDGRCRYNIASAIGEAKEKISEAVHGAVAQHKEVAHEAKEMAHEAIREKKRIAHEAKDKIENLSETAKEKASQKTNEAKRKFEGAYKTAKERASQKTHEAKGKFEDAYDTAKEKASEKTHEAKDKIEDAYETAKEKTHEAKDKIEDIYETTKEKASQKTHQAREMVEDKYERAKESATQKAHDVKPSAKESINEVKERAEKSLDTLSMHVRHNVSKQAKNVKDKTTSLLRYLASAEALNSLTNVVNLLGLATAYGMCVWVTFFSSYVLAGVLARQQFGVVHSKIYPVYFRAMAYSILVALLGHLVRQRKLLFTNKAEMFQAFDLVAATLAVLVNASYLEPLATKVMFERMRIEKEEGRGQEIPTSESRQPVPGVAAATTTSTGASTETPESQRREEEIRRRIDRMSRRLKRLNSYSSFLNILTLMALTWHLVYLGHCLNVTC